MNADTQSYWAFISYSHADEKWATWLHRSLERYRIPRSLDAGTTAPKRLFPVFRDREELPSTPRLPEKIRHALDASSALIVVCSPYGRASKWVNTEVAYFKSTGRADRVFCLVVDGEPNASDDPNSGMPEAFPEAVRFDVDSEQNITPVRAEPLAADVRRGGDSKRLALLKLVAGILDVGLDKLRLRDRRRRIQGLITATSAALLVAGIVGAALVNQQRETATERARATAGQLLNRAAELSSDEVEPKLLLTATASMVAREGTGAVMPEAEMALYRALESSRLMGEIVQDRSGGGGWIWAPVIDPAGERVVFPGESPTLLHDVHLKQAIALTEAGATLSATFLDDGTLVTASEDGVARFWNAAGELVSARELHPSNLLSVVFNPVRDFAISVGCAEGDFGCPLVARLWDSDWQQRAEISQSGESVTSAAWLSDGGTFVTADTAGLVQRWNTDGSRIGSFSNPNVWLGPGAMGRDRILTGRQTPWRNGGMFDPLSRIERTARPRRDWDTTTILNLSGTVVVPAIAGDNGAFSRNGQTWLSVENMEVTVRNEQGRVLSSFDVGEPVEDAEFSPDGSLIAVGTEYSLSLYTAGGELVERAERDARAYGPLVRFGPDGAMIAAAVCHDAHQGACLAHTVQVWDLAGSLERVIQLRAGGSDPRNGVSARPPLVRYSRSGKLIFAAPNNATDVYIIDADGDVLATLPAPGTVIDAEFDAATDIVRVVLSNAGNGNAAIATAIWDWRNDSELTALQSLDDEVTWADWDTDGRLAVVDSSLRITALDASSRELFSARIDEEDLVQVRPTDWVPRYTVQFSASGQALVAASVSDARVDVQQDSRYSGEILSTMSSSDDSRSSWRIDPLGTPLVIGDRVLVVACTDRFYGATIGRGTTCRDSDAQLLDLEGNLVATLDNPLDEDWNPAFVAADSHEASGRLVTVGDGVSLWSPEGDRLASYPGNAAAFRPDGSAIAILRDGGRLDIRQVWTDIGAMEREAVSRSVSRVSRAQCAELVGEEFCADHRPDAEPGK